MIDLLFSHVFFLLAFSNLSAFSYNLTYKFILMMFIQYAQLLWLSLLLG